jgi:hypothetical protein
MTYKFLKALVESKGHTFFDKGNFNLNIVGVRSKNKRAGKFDDMIYIAYKDGGAEQLFSAKCTTDPSAHWLKNPLNKKGTAILVPGQYFGAYKIGIHGRSWKSGGYPALEQVKPMLYWRDNNKDYTLDMRGNKYRSVAKTNIHRASKWKIEQWVGRYSAGCQVIQNIDKFNKFIYICRIAKKVYGNKFTYTLIQQ